MNGGSGEEFDSLVKKLQPYGLVVRPEIGIIESMIPEEDKGLLDDFKNIIEKAKETNEGHEGHQ